MRPLLQKLTGRAGGYHVHINHSAGLVAGIVRVQLQTNDPALSQQPVDFTIEIIGTGSLRQAAKQVIPEEAHTSWIAFHSHLLTDGRYTIKWAAGAQRGEVAVEVRNRGELAARVKEQLEADSVSLFLTEPCDSSRYTYSNEALLPWYDREDCHARLDTLLETNKVPPELEHPFRHFLDKGWLEIEDHLDAALLERLNAAMDHAAANGESGFVPGSSQRLQRMHLKYQAFWDVTTYPKTQAVVDSLMQVPSNVCQVIGFVNGTQQAPHQDTIHLTAFPRGYMCGAWLALEDIQPDSGELVVYPGSHRWGPVLMQDFDIAKVQNAEWSDFARTVEAKWGKMIAESRVEPVIYRPKAGSLLVWHDRLMHGGSRRVSESLTRKSCVTHHFAQGSIVYYDSTGLPGKLIERDEQRSLPL
jgi:hypothetical protein